MAKNKEITNLPSPTSGSLSLYLSQIKKFPMLDAEEEYLLAKNWKERGNLKAAHKLVTSHIKDGRLRRKVLNYLKIYLKMLKFT